MENFQLVLTGLDVHPLLHTIQRNPGLWNQYRFRTTYVGTPHVDVDDIWLRYPAANLTDDPAVVAKAMAPTHCQFGIRRPASFQIISF